MIRFATPLLLLLALVPAAALVLFRARLRALLLPCLAALAFIAALAGPEIRRAEGGENVFLLVDRSSSVTASATADEVDGLAAAVQKANPGVSFGTIDFASRAVLAVPLAAHPTPASLPPVAASLGSGTDLGAAVRLGLGALPRGEANQLVLLSDGRVTGGLLDALSAAREQGVPISVVPLGRSAPADVALVGLETPALVDPSRPFLVTATVRSDEPGEALLALYRNGEMVSSSSITLAAGLSRFEVRQILEVAGTYSYRASVKKVGDPLADNDSLSAFTEVGASSPLLVVSQSPADALLAALAAPGRLLATRPSVPSLEELAGRRQVVLTGLPLGGLGPTDIATLRSFVSEMGGSLLVAEGEAELRGLREAAIEDLLPVSYTLPQRAEQASLAVVYLLDRSASMLGSAAGAMKIDIVREAAAASVGLLGPDAAAGVIAFDRDLRWLSPVGSVGDGSAIYASLRTLEASGGTDIFGPVTAALDALEAVSARVKHVLLLSDGKTVDEPRDWEGLLARLAAQSDIHVSAIAVGPQPNRELLARLVEAGRGTLYTATDVATLPQVSIEATQRLSRSRFVTEESPVAGTLVIGDLATLPPVQGYALTYPRPTADVLLSVANDPIFARWRLGLGWVGVLNVDLSGVWSRDWLAWERASLLLDTLLLAVEPDAWAAQGLELWVDVESRPGRLRVEAREPDGSYADFLALTATVVPGGDRLILEQTAPGLYETDLPDLKEGAYIARVTDAARDRVATLPFSVPYPAEARELGVDAETLSLIARATGGEVLRGNMRLAERTASGAASYFPAHRPFLLGGLLLFLLELGCRKIPRAARRGAS